MRLTMLTGVVALVVLVGTVLLPVRQVSYWDDLTVEAAWPCPITGLSAAGVFPGSASADAPPERIDFENLLCTRPARRTLQTALLVGLVAVGSVAVIERYRQSAGGGETDNTTSNAPTTGTMRMTRAAGWIAAFVMIGTALLPAPQWLEEFELLSPELACPVTVLSAAGVLPSGYDPGPNILPSELAEARAECTGPAQTRLVTVLFVCLVGVQAVAVLEYSKSRRSSLTTELGSGADSELVDHRG